MGPIRGSTVPLSAARPTINPTAAPRGAQLAVDDREVNTTSAATPTAPAKMPDVVLVTSRTKVGTVAEEGGEDLTPTGQPEPTGQLRCAQDADHRGQQLDVAVERIATGQEPEHCEVVLHQRRASAWAR